MDGCVRNEEMSKAAKLHKAEELEQAKVDIARRNAFVRAVNVQIYSISSISPQISYAREVMM